MRNSIQFLKSIARRFRLFLRGKWNREKYQETNLSAAHISQVRMRVERLHALWAKRLEEMMILPIPPETLRQTIGKQSKH